MPEKSKPLPHSQVVLAPKSLWSINFRERRKKFFPQFLLSLADMIPCCDTGRGSEKRKAQMCLYVTSLLWATPRVTLPFSTECGRTFSVNHLHACQQTRVRNRRWKGSHRYRDKVKNKGNCCRAAASCEVPLSGTQGDTSWWPICVT